MKNYKMRPVLLALGETNARSNKTGFNWGGRDKKMNKIKSTKNIFAPPLEKKQEGGTKYFLAYKKYSCAEYNFTPMKRYFQNFLCGAYAIYL